MRSYRELSVRYIKSKKARSLWIMFGIIISVALIMGIYTLVDSFENKMLQDIERESRYHVYMLKVKDNEVKEIIKDIKLEEAAFNYVSGGIVSDFSKHGYKDVFIQKSSKDTFSLLVFDNKLTSGRIPEKKGELLVSLAYLESIGKKVGDNINIEYQSFDDLKMKSIQGTVVGTSNDKSIYEYIDISDIEEDKSYEMFLRYKNPKDTVDAIEAIGEKFGYENIANGQVSEGIDANYNETYLTLLGADVGDGVLQLINKMKMVLIFLVAISSIGLIYNGFMISISERKKEFGLLRAVGISKKQIKIIVIKEAIIIGTTGICIGIVSGILGIYVLLKVVSKINVTGIGVINLSLSPFSILFSVLISIITIAISTYIPLRKASKVTAVEGMRNSFVKEDNIKFKEEQSIVTRFFGAAGYLANTSLRRNKGRFRAVILGFTLSIFIFVSFSSFIEISIKMMEIQNNVSGFDLEYRNSSNSSNDDIIKDVEGIKDVYSEYRFVANEKSDFRSSIDKYKIVKEDYISDKVKELNDNSIIFDYKTVDYTALKNMNLSNKVDKEKYDNGIIIQNKAIMIEGNKKSSVDLTTLKVGEKIDIEISYYTYNVNDENSNQEQKSFILKDVEIAGFIEDGVTVTSSQMDMPSIYLGNNISEKIINEIGVEKEVIVKKIVPESEEYSQTIYNELNSNQEKYDVIYINSPLESQREWAKLMLITKIGVYGFLILITLITITNIITSVSSSIDNKRKEIALLRSVGTSHKVIKKMIIIENLSYFIYSIFFGSILGTLSSILISIAVSSMYGGIYVIPIKSIIIVMILLLLFIMLISRYSIKKLCRNNIIEEIREE